jgi:glycosyltransferase involved in cell wall biosynthesis
MNILFLESLLYNPYKECLIQHLNTTGVKINILDVSRLRNFIFCFKLIGIKKPDIFHFHDLHRYTTGRNKITKTIKFSLFLIQIKFLKKLGIKLIWTVHEWEDRIHGGKRNIPKSYCKIIGQLFDAVITHCETTKKEVSQALELKPENIFVIPHGHYIGSYENKINCSEARKKLNIPEENLVFLLFGNIHRTKGFLDAISAFKRLKQAEIYLIIAGYPAEDEDIIFEESKDHKNIAFIPKVIPNEEIQIYMNACDCVVLPYRVFTTSGVAILAMSFGKACLAPRAKFFEEVLDDEGSFLYEYNQPDGLLQAMKQAIDKKNDLPKMGQHNLSLAKQWNWERIAEKTFHIYQECLKIK